MPTAAAEETIERKLSRENENFYPLLDFLRSAAVLMVVFDHTMLALGIEAIGPVHTDLVGLIGVFMFFVHTSLVLMWSLERKPYTLDFYIRRIFRIYPLAWAAMMVALLTKAPLLGVIGDFFQWHPTTPGNFVMAGLLLYDLVPKLGYQPIVDVIWTLPLEMHMYLLLPVLFAFARRDRALWPLLLMWGLACMVALSSALSFASAIPMFLPGVMAFVLFKKVKPRLSPWIFPIVLFLLVAATLLSVRHNIVHLGWFFCLTLGLCLPWFQQFPRSWFTKACHQVAKYSYGIYLTHPFALAAGLYLLRRHSLWLQLNVFFPIVIFVPILTYHALEKPMIDFGSRLAARIEARILARRPQEARNSL